MSWSPKYKKILALAVLLLLPGTFFIIFGLLGEHQFETLPYYGPKEAVTKEVGGETVTDTFYHQLPDFRFHDQDGNVITRDFFDDKILVAEFFRETTRLKRIFMEFGEEPDIYYMSHTTDPGMNKKAELKFYADRIHADTSKWKFVHAPVRKFEALAIEGYFKESAPDTNIRELIRHPVLILIDKQHRVRGVYDGDFSEEVSRLMDEIRLLKKEEDLQEYRS